MHKTWKWKLASAAAAIAVAGAAPVAHAALCGDSDNNGSVAINDVVLQFKVVSGLALPSSICGAGGYADCGNLNGDQAGTTDTADTVLLLRKASGILNCPSDTCKPQSLVTGCACADMVHLTGCSGTGTLPSHITGNLLAPKGCDVHVHGVTFVDAGGILTVQKGETIKGDKGASPPSAFVVKTGGRLNAVGTLAEPILWTSDQPTGSKQRQDWGGVNLLGKAPVNQPNITMEGLLPSPDTLYGGSDPNDFSGCMSYNRVEFSGVELSPDTELNTISLYGIGRGTRLDHLQAHHGFDDCIEWFGGTVNGQYFVSSSCGDDGFDTQLGTSGALQFGLVVDEGATIESPGSNGYEQDNSEFGFNNTPFNDPKYCNTTIIGTRYSGDNNTVQNSFGILSRRGNAMTIANTIISHWRGGGYTLRDPETAVHACTNQTTLNTAAPVGLIESTIFEDNGPGGGAVPNPPIASLTAVVDSTCPNTCAGGTNPGTNCTSNSACTGGGTCTGASTVCTCTAADHIALLAAKNVITTSDATIDAIGGKTFPPINLVPPAGSLAATHPAVDCTTIDSSFVKTNYIGAFQPGGPDWTAGWTAYPEN
jgi:hypothetical protein